MKNILISSTSEFVFKKLKHLDEKAHRREIEKSYLTEYLNRCFHDYKQCFVNFMWPQSLNRCFSGELKKSHKF